MRRITLATLALTLAPTTLLAQAVSTEQWQSESLHDDFTDGIDKVGTLVRSIDEDSVFGIVCQVEQEVLSANISFNEYLGKGDGRVRWRIGDREAHTEQWQLDGNKVVAMLYEPRIAGLIKQYGELIKDEESTKAVYDLFTHQPLIYEILSLPDSPPDMIYEVTDSSGDRHRGKITLRGAKATVAEALDACPSWNTLSSSQ